MADPLLEQQEQQDIRSKLIRRILIAATLVTAIGIAIPLLDRLPAAPEVIQSNPTISPVQVSNTLADTPKDSAPTQEVPAKPEETAPETEKTSAVTLSAKAQQTPNPQEQATPASAATQATTSNPKTTALTTPAVTAQPPQPRAEKPVTNSPTTKPEPKVTTAASNPPPAPQALKPTTQSQPPTAPARQTPVNPSLQQPAAEPSFNVQAGVFVNSNNAEKLLSQLKAAGIPAYLESRVQVGPFKNRAEADLAANKLRAMGIAPVISQNVH